MEKAIVKNKQRIRNSWIFTFLMTLSVLSLTQIQTDAEDLKPEARAETNPTPTPTPDANASDANGNTPLHLAVREGNLTRATELVKNGLDVNAANNRGETPVTLSADLRKTQMLLMLLTNGGDLDSAVTHLVKAGDERSLRSVAGQYPIKMTDEMFDRAMTDREYGIAELALKYGVEADYGLAAALKQNTRQIIEASLNAGANADLALQFGMEHGDVVLARLALDKYKASPDLGMNLAISKDDLSILQLALSKGADPSRGLAEAARSGNEHFVEVMLDARADPNAGIVPAAAARHDRIVLLLVTRGANPNPAMPFAVRANNEQLITSLLRANASGTDPQLIAIAAGNNNQRVAQMLISAGADPTAGMMDAVRANSVEMTRFLVGNKATATDPRLISTAANKGNQELVALLLENGANATAGLPGAVDGGQVAIVEHLLNKKANATDPRLIAGAAEKGRGRIVSLLLAAGANAEAGMKPAVMAGFADVVEILIKAGASAKPPDYIVYACQSANTAMAVILLKNEAPKDTVDAAGQPLIHIAALTAKDDLVTALLGLGVDGNAKNRAGDTALHVIARNSASTGYPKFKKMKKARLPVLKALIDGGVNVNVANSNGDFALKHADGDDVKDLLKQAGGAKDQKDLDKRTPKPVKQTPFQ